MLLLTLDMHNSSLSGHQIYADTLAFFWADAMVKALDHIQGQSSLAPLADLSLTSR